MPRHPNNEGDQVAPIGAGKATLNPTVGARSLALKRFAASGMASAASAARAGCQFRVMHGHEVLFSLESAAINAFILRTDRFSCLSGTGTYRILLLQPRLLTLANLLHLSEASRQ